MTVPSPSATNSPHLGGIQPTWRDLPFASEFVRAAYVQEQNYAEVRDKFIGASGKSKTDQMTNFLGKVGILSDDGELNPNGVFLAEAYSKPSQDTLGESVQHGVKDKLAPAEQLFWKTLLFERDWLPMLATLNIVATRDVSTQETKSRAEAFQHRLDHLDKYQSFESINTWKKKAQTHFGWLEHTGLARSDDRNRFELTDTGQSLHEHVKRQYHPDWPTAIRE